MAPGRFDEQAAGCGAGGAHGTASHSLPGSHTPSTASLHAQLSTPVSRQGSHHDSRQGSRQGSRRNSSSGGGIGLDAGESSPSAPQPQGLDIGAFVEVVQEILVQLAPLMRLARRVHALLSWERRLQSLVAFTVCFLVAVYPSYIPLLALVLAAGCALVGYLQKGVDLRLHYAADLRRAFELIEAKRPQREYENKRKELMYFHRILCVSLERLRVASARLKQGNRVYTWEDGATATRVVGGLMAGLLLLAMLPAAAMLPAVVVAVFAAYPQFVETGVVELPMAKDGPTPPGAPQKSPRADGGWVMVDDKEQVPADVSSVPPAPQQRRSFSGRRKTSSATISAGGNSNGGPARPRGGSESHARPRRRASVSSSSGPLEACSGCGGAFTFLRKRQYCRHCGNSFCSKCCRFKVPRSMFGATSPAAERETVRVCQGCNGHLRSQDHAVHAAGSASADVSPAPTPGTTRKFFTPPNSPADKGQSQSLLDALLSSSRPRSTSVA